MESQPSMRKLHSKMRLSAIAGASWKGPSCTQVSKSNEKDSGSVAVSARSLIMS